MLGITRGLAKKLFAGKTDKNQCTAWVNFDGATATITASYSVVSLIRVAAGRYRATHNFNNANYSAVWNWGSSGSNLQLREQYNTANYAECFITADSSATGTDIQNMNLIIVGGR